MTMCESVDWSIKVGDGQFIVDIYVGNPAHSEKIDIKVNDEYIAGNKLVKRGDLNKYQKNIESINGYFIFTTECEVNCEFSRSIINTIEITPFVSDKIKDAAGKQTGIFSKTSEEELCGNRRSSGKY